MIIPKFNNRNLTVNKTVKKNIIIIIVSIVLAFTIGWFLNQVQTKNSNNQQNILESSENDSNSSQSGIINNNTIHDYCDDIVTLNPLRVKYSENDDIINCDSSFTNSEYNYCSGVKACLIKRELDSLNNVLIHIYDSLIIEQNKEIDYWNEKGDTEMIKYITDYQTIKKLHIESVNKYIEYAYLEKTLTGVLSGNGRIRTAIENYRLMEILDKKNIELKLIINEYQK